MKVCAYCKKEFEEKDSHQKYCSMTCLRAARKERRGVAYYEKLRALKPKLPKLIQPKPKPEEPSIVAGHRRRTIFLPDDRDFIVDLEALLSSKH
jgi:hypothetical protein